MMLTFVPFDCLKIKTFSLNVYSQIGSLKIRFQSKLSNFFIILLSKKMLSIILISGGFFIHHVDKNVLHDIKVYLKVS